MNSIRTTGESPHPRLKIAVALLAVVVVGLSTGPAQATVITQTFAIDHGEEPFPQLSLDYFDTMGGTRTLTGVSIELDAVASLDINAENLSASPVTGWFLDSAILPRFEILDAKKSSFGIGASPYPLLSADFAASDGVEGSGPDFVQFETNSTNLHGDIDFNPIDFALFEGIGSVDALLNLPLSFAIPPLPIGFAATRHEVGSLVVTYEYVPEPSTLAMLSIGGTLLMRRKR